MIAKSKNKAEHKEDQSCLGLPVSDKEPAADGSENRFEYGITAGTQNAAKAEVICRIQQSRVCGFPK